MTTRINLGLDSGKQSIYKWVFDWKSFLPATGLKMKFSSLIFLLFCGLGGYLFVPWSFFSEFEFNSTTWLFLLLLWGGGNLFFSQRQIIRQNEEILEILKSRKRSYY